MIHGQKTSKYRFTFLTLGSIATFIFENCCNDPTRGPKELSKAGIDYFANVLSHTFTRLCKNYNFYVLPFLSHFILVSPPSSENRHHLFPISVHRHILSYDLSDRETYRCSLMFKQSRSACVNSRSHGYKAGMRVVSITTTRAADTCVRQHSTIVFVTRHAYSTLQRHHAPEKAVCLGMWRRGKGRERSRKFGPTEYKRDKRKRQKSEKNGNKESVPQQMWRDISNILWQVRRWNFVARTAHDGTIDSARFIVSAQNSTDFLSFFLSFCCFKLIGSKL